ncbi:MAG TPA: hypothetical protein VJZ03_00845 [Candidatus Bathyarchaeia archaeon]|nr:hypothetical protein [Candidatus Bathyarchaeia archaeon]
MANARFQEFNKLFCQAIDQSISEMIGSSGLSSLYSALENYYSITRDELPYRLETVYSVLESVFGIKVTHTIEKRIVRRFYDTLDIPFTKIVGYTLQDYVEAVRKRIRLSSLNSLSEYIRLL